MSSLYNPPPTFVYMVWITPKLDQMVRFPGKIVDIRKRDMLLSDERANKKIPAGTTSAGIYKYKGC
jgi:hypothetical protein